MNGGFNLAAWFLALAPLSFSPGPANVLFAAMGAAFGFKASLPFLSGIILVSVIQSLLIGFGIAILVNQSPLVAGSLKWGGVLVLLYFAIRFFRSKVASRSVSAPLGFREGVVLQIFNGKFFLIPALMFSLFHTSESNSVEWVLGLTAALAALTLSANILWLAAGKVLASVLEEAWFEKYQGTLFGSVLAATALWIAAG